MTLFTHSVILAMLPESKIANCHMVEREGPERMSVECEREGVKVKVRESDRVGVA